MGGVSNADYSRLSSGDSVFDDTCHNCQNDCDNDWNALSADVDPFATGAKCGWSASEMPGVLGWVAEFEQVDDTSDSAVRKPFEERLSDEDKAVIMDAMRELDFPTPRWAAGSTNSVVGLLGKRMENRMHVKSQNK